MTQPTTPDSTPEAGKQAPPTPALSSPSVDKPNSANSPSQSLNADDLIEKLLAHPKFKPRLDAAVQSVKDKRFAELERAKMYLDANGQDVAKARREMLMDEVESQLLAKENGGTVPSQPVQGDLQAKTAKLTAQFGIADNDPELTQLVNSRQWSSEFEWLEAVSTLGARRLRGETPPPPGSLVPDGGSGAPAVLADKATQLETYTRELKNLTEQPTLNFNRIVEIKEKMKTLVAPK